MRDRTYTPAQRRALLALTGEWKSNPESVGHMPCHALARRFPDICERYQVYSPMIGPFWKWRLTPAGLAEKERIMALDHGGCGLSRAAQ
jgi:hypothetical protein